MTKPYRLFAIIGPPPDDIPRRTANGRHIPDKERMAIAVCEALADRGIPYDTINVGTRIRRLDKTTGELKWV